jgi:hypothetical protein
LTVAGYLAAAAWTGLISYPLQSGSTLLTALVLSLLLFVGGVIWKRSVMVLYSWIGLAAVSLFAQALGTSEASVLGSVAAVIYFLVMIDLYQFLQRIRQTTTGSKAVSPTMNEEGWSLLRGRFGRTLVFALAAGGIVVSGFAIGGSALVSSNPVLVTAAVSLLLLTLTTLLVTGSGRKEADTL